MKEEGDAKVKVDLPVPFSSITCGVIGSRCSAFLIRSWYESSVVEAGSCEDPEEANGVRVVVVVVVLSRILLKYTIFISPSLEKSSTRFTVCVHADPMTKSYFLQPFP